MVTTQFDNLEYGYIYICNGKDQSTRETEAIATTTQSILPSYKVTTLATTEEHDGMLIIRRANLGVFEGYGILIAPALEGMSIEQRTRALAETFLDLQSTRNEKTLYLDQQTMRCGNNVFLLANAVTSIDKIFDNEFKKSFYFWDTLHKETEEPKDKSKATTYWQIKEEQPKTRKWFSNFSYERIIPKSFQKSSVEEREETCGDIAEREDKTGSPAFEPDPEYVEEIDAVDIIDEKEQLAKEIATLIRKYILKYGKIEEEKIKTMLQGKITLHADKLSTLIVNRDCKIILQEHNETELKVGGPLPTSLYILMLRHSEGIVLKDISNYKNELLSIHSLVAPLYDEEKVKNKIDNIYVNINQTISKINAAIKSTIPIGDIASNYTINGNRNSTYKIPITQKENYVTIMPKF